MAERLKASILKIEINKFYRGFKSYFIQEDSLDSSVVEHRIENPCVMGSNPILDKNCIKMLRGLLFSNRPISPHLTIYTPQQSSLFSIWHRISGVLLLLAIFTSIVITNNIVLCGIQNSWFEVYFSIPREPLRISLLSIMLALIYHTTNGIRHIFWDLGILLHKNYLTHFTFVMIFVLSFTIIML